MKKTATILASLFVVTAVLCFQAIGAGNQKFCNNYADTAVKQYNLGKQHNLPGIVPPAWSDNRDGHYNWCMMAPEKIANSENAKRQAYLDQHIPKSAPSTPVVTGVVTGTVKSLDLSGLIGMKTNICESYAKKSVNQNKKNISLQCGFKNPSWSSDYKAHFNWCMHGENYLHVDNASGSREKQLQACGGGNIIWIPGMVIGLRNTAHQENDPFVPGEEYFFQEKDNLKRVLASDYPIPSSSHAFWSWITVKKGNFSDASQYRLPTGIVIGLVSEDGFGSPAFGIKNPRTGLKYIGSGNFQRECGGDIGAPIGTGLCWYESTGLGFHDWSAVNNLPAGTVIGLKHSSNQPNKKLKWHSHIYDPVDPNIQPPPGFARKNGGDESAPAGVGYFWYEKITGQ